MPAPTATAVPAKVLLVAREGSLEMGLMLTKEVPVMVRVLEEAGFKVEIASVSGQPIVGTATTLKPDLRLADVKVEDHLGLSLPNFAAGDLDVSIAEPAEAVEVVKKPAALGKPIAAAVSAVLILDKAGALDGKEFAIRYDYRVFVHTGTCGGEGVI